MIKQWIRPVLVALVTMAGVAFAQGYGGEAAQYGQFLPRNGSKSMTGDLHVVDDVLVEYGNTGAAPDFWCEHDTSTNPDEWACTTTDSNGAGADKKLFAVPDGTDDVTYTADVLISSGAVHTADDVLTKYGNTNAAPDVWCEFDTAAAPDEWACNTTNGDGAGTDARLFSFHEGTDDIYFNVGQRIYLDENGDDNDFIACTANDTCRWTVGGTALIQNTPTTSVFAGSVTSTATGSLGWAVVDGADNTACTSQCTGAAVFGLDLAAGATAPAMVGPADATADICLCAGAS